MCQSRPLGHVARCPRHPPWCCGGLLHGWPRGRQLRCHHWRCGAASGKERTGPWACKGQEQRHDGLGWGLGCRWLWLRKRLSLGFIGPWLRAGARAAGGSGLGSDSAQGLMLNTALVNQKPSHVALSLTQENHKELLSTRSPLMQRTLIQENHKG